MPSNITTNTYTFSAIFPVTFFFIIGVFGSIMSILLAGIFWDEFRQNRSTKTTVNAILFSLLALFLIVLTWSYVAEIHRQHAAMKTTTFKVASVSRNTADGDNTFVYHVKDNKFGVKTITASTYNASIASDTMADESKVKTITIKYGKTGSPYPTQKNVYEIIERTYQ